MRPTIFGGWERKIILGKIIPVLLGLLYWVFARRRRICRLASLSRLGCLRNDWSASEQPYNTTSTTSALRAR